MCSINTLFGSREKWIIFLGNKLKKKKEIYLMDMDNGCEISYHHLFTGNSEAKPHSLAGVAFGPMVFGNLKGIREAMDSGFRILV